MERRNKRFFALLISGLSLAVTVTVASAAWFTGGTTIGFEKGQQVPIEAGAEPSYFAYGDGSSDHPYGIRDRVHLYNLAWLQYIGYFDGSSTLRARQPYFVLDDEIPESGLDMSGITLPPIGSEQYPFLGHFDGNGKTITNLTISNDNPLASSSDFGVMKPSLNSLQGTTPPEIVGFFGVVGAYNLANNVTYDSSIISMENFTLNNLVVESKTTKTLIGLAAGYVDGNVSGIKISGNATLNLGTSGKQIVNNAITSNVSDYGLVGFAKQTGSSGSFSQSLSKYYLNEDPNHGNSGFGAQLDIQKINMHIYDSYLKKPGDSGYNANMELTNMKATTAMNASYTSLQTFRDYKVYFGTRYINTRYNSDTRYGYYMNPNSFVGSNRASDYPAGYTVNSAPTERAVEYQLLDNAFIPLVQDPDNAAYASPNNNAYLTGYSLSGYQGNVKLSSHYTGGIGCSLSKDCNTNTVTAVQYNYDYNDNRVDILGYDSTSGNFYIIDDGKISASNDRNTALSSYTTKSLSSFNYNMYNNARSKFGEMMTRDGNKRIHSVCFIGNDIHNYQTYTPETNGKIYFNGQQKTSLQMPKGCIDFTVKQNGYINFLAANYNYQSRSNYRFFSLYKITRNTSGGITSVQKIHKIFENKATNPSSKYIYQFNNDSGSYSSSEARSTNSIFNVTSALETNRSLTNVLYYFEIPVDEGEYAIAMAEGANTSSLMGAHLIYLDIGINGGEVQDTKVTGYSITTDASGYKFPSGVDFKVVGTTAITTGGVSFCVSLGASTSGTAKFIVSSNNVNIDSSPTNIKYSYQGSNWVSGSPPSGKFNVTNGPSTYTPFTYANKTRVSHISVPAASGRAEILVTDVLNGSTITSTVYKLGSDTYTSADTNGSPVIPSEISAVAPLFTPSIVTDVRSLVEAIALTRDNSGTIATFDSVLPVLPWDNADAYVVKISPYPSGLKINCTRATATYSLSINGNNVAFSNNSAIYPTS